MNKEKEDIINHPNHYKAGNIETIHIIKQILGKKGFESYCIGNAIKYASRAGHKLYPNKTKDESKAIDIEKRNWYIERAASEQFNSSSNCGISIINNLMSDELNREFGKPTKAELENESELFLSKNILIERIVKLHELGKESLWTKVTSIYFIASILMVVTNLIDKYF